MDMTSALISTVTPALLSFANALTEIVAGAKNNGNAVSESVFQSTMKDARADEVNMAKDYLMDQGVAIVPDALQVEVMDETPDEPDGVQPYDPSKIDITQQPQSLDNLLSRLEYNEIDLMPDFQRKAGLWTLDQQSRLIESLILRIPLPAFYFDGTKWDRWIIIDGLQRLTALKAFFLDQTLRLSGLEYLKELNGAGYNDMPRHYIRRMKETQIYCYIINPGAPDNLKYNIFKRVNTGGLELEPQEIRHALFQGFATTYLKELAEMPSFVETTGHSIPTDRMLDREFVLRFLSFYELDPQRYKGVIDDYLIEGMKHINREYGADRIYAEMIKVLFDNVLRTCGTIFGRFAFRRMPDLERRRTISKALFTVWTVLLAKHTPGERKILEERKQLLLDLYIPMFTKDEEFYKSIGSGQSAAVRKQFQKIEGLIENVLSSPEAP